MNVITSFFLGRYVFSSMDSEAAFYAILVCIGFFATVYFAAHVYDRLKAREKKAR